MSDQRLFAVPKVALYCDGISHGTEVRQGDEVKIVTLALRVQPFDSKLAVALDDGLILADGSLRSTLFELNTAEPRDHLRRVDFALGIPRQRLVVFASSDTAKPSILLDQVRITNLVARKEKGDRAFGLTFKASFGPLGKVELAYIEAWRLEQRFVTFETAEPNLAFEETAAADEAGDDDGPEQPEFDTESDGKPIEEPERAQRPLHTARMGKGKGKPNGADGPPASAGSL